MNRTAATDDHRIKPPQATYSIPLPPLATDLYYVISVVSSLNSPKSVTLSNGTSQPLEVLTTRTTALSGIMWVKPDNNNYKLVITGVDNLAPWGIIKGEGSFDGETLTVDVYRIFRDPATIHNIDVDPSVLITIVVQAGALPDGAALQ